MVMRADTKRSFSLTLSFPSQYQILIPVYGAPITYNVSNRFYCTIRNNSHQVYNCSEKTHFGGTRLVRNSCIFYNLNSRPNRVIQWAESRAANSFHTDHRTEPLTKTRPLVLTAHSLLVHMFLRWADFI